MLLNQTLLQFIQDLHTERIKSFAGGTIYTRGKRYHQNEQVTSLEVKNATTICAEVVGSEEYAIELAQVGKDMQISCDCPYEGYPCKHIVAVLLDIEVGKKHILQTLQSFLDTVPKKVTKDGAGEPKMTEQAYFEQYLASLPTSELIALAQQYVPDSFKKKIFLQALPTKQQADTFQKTKQNIEALLRKKYKTSSSLEKFEAKLEEYLALLSGIWTNYWIETGDLFIYLIETIESKAEEGDIGNDDYDDYNYYSDEENSYTEETIEDYLVDFLSDLPTPQKLKAFQKLWGPLKNLNYVLMSRFTDNFDDYFDETDKPALLALLQALLSSPTAIDMSLVKKLMSFLDTTLSDAEKEVFWENQYPHDGEIACQYALYYAQKYGEVEKPIKILGGYTHLLTQKGNQTIFITQLIANTAQHLAQQGSTFLWLLKAYPKHYVLAEIITVSPTQTTYFEKILGQENAQEYAVFLEKNNRLEEALAILEKSGNQYDFYVRHKTTFPLKAHVFFGKKLSEIIDETGDKNYETIVALLKQLESLIPPEDFKNNLTIIRETYKRRTNLIKLLNIAFKK